MFRPIAVYLQSWIKSRKYQNNVSIKLAEHLKSFDYLPAECEQMRLFCDRLSRAYSSSLEESVQKFLEMLGKLKRPYLTAVEGKVLSVLESEIKVQLSIFSQTYF
ncbi:MAG: hypothetical protein V7K48_08450 [Nostoc sp.]|uniref:hypothetical protein n=1 Tax=Nostoc sp. TaxID=1180 RepID=UPI002FF8377F